MEKEWHRRYAVYTFGVPTKVLQPWHPTVWPQIESRLAFVNELSRRPLALRGRAAYRRDNGSYASRGLGRLAWNAKSSVKWTTSDPGAGELPIGAHRLEHIQAWGPHWSKCFHGQGAPDFYFFMTTNIRIQMGLPNRWCAELLTALAVDFPRDALTIFDDAVREIATGLNGSHIARREAPWGVDGVGGIGFSSLIQDGRPFWRVPSDEVDGREAHEVLGPEWELLSLPVRGG